MRSDAKTTASRCLCAESAHRGTCFLWADCGKLKVRKASDPGNEWEGREHEAHTTCSVCGAGRCGCARRARNGLGQRSDEVERDRREHRELAAGDRLGAAGGEHLRG